MNALEWYLFAEKLSEPAALNELQEGRVISDLCVTAAEVARADCDAAVNFLKRHPVPLAAPR